MSPRQCAAGHELARAGQRCRWCRVELVARRVTAADSALDPDEVAAAIEAVAAAPAVLGKLTRALQTGPGPLSAGAPPTVGRLVVELRTRGSTLPQPTCARCGRTDRPLTASADGGVCPNCRRRQLAEACARCGIVKPVASRDGQRRALCAACAPRPRRPCSGCGRVRVIARRARGVDGDLCDVCYREPAATCRMCGREKPCHFVAEGRPICLSCSPRRQLPCAHCGHTRPPAVRWPEGPVCEPCYRAALARRGLCTGCGSERRLVVPPGPTARFCADCAGVPPLATCRSCGAEERPYHQGCCVRCALAERARDLTGGPHGPFPAVYQAIIAAPQPYSAHNWLRSAAGATILAELAAGTLPLTHRALDTHPRPRAANFLRHLLVAHGVLPARDDVVVRLEAWVAARLDELTCPGHRRLLRSYATWRVLRRARRRAEHVPRAHTPTRHAKNCLLAAIAFLAFLEHRDRDLASCTQADIDAWLNEGPPSAPNVRDFLAWATERKHVNGVDIPRPPRLEGPALHDDTRWAIVNRLLHDDALDLGDRTAGCLVLLYGQQLSRIVALTRDQIRSHHGGVRLHLGATHIEIPEPLGGILTRLARSRRPYTGIGTPPDQPWLFPGLHPGRPLTPAGLGRRLRQLGIGAMPGRRSALIHLAARLPAAVLADLLNIAPTSAVRWVRTAGGDWTTYAAQLIHDRDREP